MLGKEGERGLVRLEDSVDSSLRGLEDNIKKRKGLNTTASNSIDNIRTNGTTITRKQKWKENGFKWQICKISRKKTWMWLRKRKLKSETKSILIAAQNNTIRTYVKAKNDNTQDNSKFRLCANRDETINHTISECSKLAERDVDYTGWERWSTRNCARNWNLTIQTNDIYTNHNPSYRMRRRKFSGILRYK